VRETPGTVARRTKVRNTMGIFDKAKDAAGKAKDKVDDLVEANSDKIPDAVEGAYDKASDAAEKVIPGEQA
jgi:uncharacterized protein YjbJ (UPF0337 family)